MTDRPSIPEPAPARRPPLAAAALVVAAVFAGSIYANLSFAVTRPAEYRFFPPFVRGVNANDNRHLGAEYFNIAKALRAGEGFANPFGEKTGPTAWMPPVLPTILAAILWACGGDKDAVMAVVVFLQVYVLVATGLLAVVLAWRTSGRFGAWAAAAVFCGALVCDFHLCFQFTHDCWLVLLALDLVVAGLCWLRPLGGWKTAAGWGALGGFVALVNPVVALFWGVGSLVLASRGRAWPRFAVAAVAAAIVLAPWTVRNYLVFGRLLPVKSNLAYELYQSQCLTKDGLIQGSTWSTHPYASAGRERQEYKALGEMVFLDRKRERFLQALSADPLDFLDRVAYRFLGVTLWYVPLDRAAMARRPGALWLGRLTHPLPFLGLLVLLFASAWRPLHPAQWAVIGAYVVYLLPYIAVSYYDRYGMPLLGVKVLLVVWGADCLLTLLRGPRRADAEEAPVLVELASP